MNEAEMLAMRQRCRINGLKDKIKVLEEGKKQDKKYADHLEDKVELLEKDNKELREAVAELGTKIITMIIDN